MLTRLLLLTVILNCATPAPADLFRVPSLVKVGTAPPWLWKTVPSNWMSKVAPARLCRTAPPPLLKKPEVQVALPALLRVRPPVILRTSPLKGRPPSASATQAPLFVPPDQVVRPLTSSVPVPANVPPLRMKLLWMFDAALRSNVPPEIVRLASLVRLVMVTFPVDVIVTPRKAAGMETAMLLGRVLSSQLAAVFQRLSPPPPSQTPAGARRVS